MMKNWKISFCLLMSAGMIVTACSNSKQGNAGEPTSGPTEVVGKSVTTEPVTITISPFVSTTDEEFALYFTDPVKKMYPHITVKREKETVVSKMLVSGQLPDIIITSNPAMADNLNMGILEDMTPLIKKHNIDTSRFDPLALDSVKFATKTGELYGLPYWMNFNALYYNKDIFDRFAVPYPEDGMTWDQTIELAKRLSRTDNGIEYKGLHYEKIGRIAMALSPDFVNRKTERANVNNEMWKSIFLLGQKIITIPGNMPVEVDSGYTNAFYLRQDTAMLASINTFFAAEAAIKSGFKMGIAQYPAYPDHPNTYGYVDPGVMLITKTSKFRDQAMQVIAVATSDEVQLAAAKKLGKTSTLKNPEMKKKLGAEVSFLQGIDLQSIFKSNPAPAPAFSVYSLSGRSIIRAKYKDFIAGKLDVNTALKQAEEEINKTIDTEMKK